MKSLHFCTPLLLQKIRTSETWNSYRTGFMPEIYEGDVIKINERNGVDSLLCHARVTEVLPIRYGDIFRFPIIEEEIARYNKQFPKCRWFFKFSFQKISFNQVKK
jgi:hypothetical protein